MEAKELWLRSGFELDISDDLTLKSQVYGYGAQRNWMNNEVAAFNATNAIWSTARGSMWPMTRQLVGNITDLTWNTNIARHG